MPERNKYNHEKIVLLAIILCLLAFSTKLIANCDMEMVLEIEAETIQAREEADYIKINQLKEEIVEYINDIETVVKFKEKFPDIRDYNQELDEVLNKLSLSLDREDLFALIELYPDLSLSKARNKLLEKSNSMGKINELKGG